MDASQTYLQLAQECQQRGQTEDRDRFWLLATDAAHAAGRLDEAERLRKAILVANPNYFLRPYGSYGEALKVPDVLNYVTELRRQYPPDQAVRWLQSLRAQAAPARSNASLPLPQDPGLANMSFNLEAPGTLKNPATNRPEPAPRGPAYGPGPLPLQKEAPKPQPRRAAAAAAPATGPKRRKKRPPPPLQPGNWVGALLFGLGLIGGLALLGHVLIWPVLAGK